VAAPPAPATAGVTPLRGAGWKAMGDKQPLGSLRLALQERSSRSKGGISSVLRGAPRCHVAAAPGGGAAHCPLTP
jgi:hypothetical protein